MNSSVFYVLVALTLISAMISVIFFMAWKTLGKKSYALSWAVAFIAATCQWFLNLAEPLFPSYEAFWLSVNACALALITLGVRGHCQRTDCRTLPENLWPYAGVVYVALVWTTVIEKHGGISMALIPAVAGFGLLLSAWIVLRHRKKTRPAEYAVAIMMTLFGLSEFVVAVLAYEVGVTGESMLSSAYLHFSFLTLPAAYTGMAMFVIFMIASDLAEQMREIAVHDELTGLLNRRGFAEQAGLAYATARRVRRPVSVVMTDIDRFKYINDEFGHAAGDAALRRFADILKETRRGEDVLARVGGEEFAIVLPGTGLADAIRIAEALCERIEASPMQIEEIVMPVTASFGVATLSKRDRSIDDIVQRADRALYRSKRAGRNRVDMESSQMLRTANGSLTTKVLAQKE